jgi:hypothetical protein
MAAGNSTPAAMQPVSRFALAPGHDGGVSGVARSALVADGRHLGMSIPGTILRYQFESAAFHVLVTSCGRAFEEAFAVVLLDRQTRRVVATRMIATHTGGWLRSVKASAEGSLLMEIALDNVERETVCWRIRIRGFSIPWVFPRLHLRRVRD